MKKTLKSQILDFIENECNGSAKWSTIHRFILNSKGMPYTSENRGYFSSYISDSRGYFAPRSSNGGILTNPNKKEPRYILKNKETGYWELHVAIIAQS